MNMNCAKWQELILLRGSGELSGRKLAGLERHLERCGECRRFAEEYAAASSALESVPLDEPSGAVLARVRRAVEERRPSPVVTLIPRVALGLAAAALVVIALVISWRGEPVSPDGGLIARGALPEGVVEDAEIEELLAAVSEEVEALGDDVALWSPAAIGEQLDEVEETLDRMRSLLEET